MKRMDRRSFLRLAGGWWAAAPVLAGLPLVGRGARQQSDIVRFRASVGLPRPPLPSYATQIVEGTVDLASESGLVTSRVLAGYPGATSDIGLPGLARVIRVTGVNAQGERLRLRGVIEDRSQLRPGESPQVEIVVDRTRGLVQAPFMGQQFELELAEV
jgi:hypothetical protein